MQLNLPTTPIHDLVVKNDDLVLATHGRSFWILDDLSPLRQFADEVARQEVHLYTPATAYRMQNATEEPPKPVMVGQNPPPGAVIYARHSDPQRFRRSDVCDFELDCRAALDDGGL